jgi:hypothetical protein
MNMNYANEINSSSIHIESKINDLDSNIMFSGAEYRNNIKYDVNHWKTELVNRLNDQIERQSNYFTDNNKTELEERGYAINRYFVENIKFEKIAIEITNWNTIFYNIKINEKQKIYLEVYPKDSENKDEELFFAYYESNNMVENGIGKEEQILYVVKETLTQNIKTDEERLLRAIFGDSAFIENDEKIETSSTSVNLDGFIQQSYFKSIGKPLEAWTYQDA